MPKYPSFFRADEEIEPSKKNSPSPNEWFGIKKTKFRTSPAFSEENEDNTPWRQNFRLDQPKDPMRNDLLIDDTKRESIRFKDENNDKRNLIFILESIADLFEELDYLDLAAECEDICESALSENKCLKR